MHASGISHACAGFNLFVAVTLVFAAIRKSRGIQSVERLFVDILPSRLWRVRGVDSRRVAWSAVGVEAAGGVVLLVTSRDDYPAVSGAVGMPLMIILMVALRAAARKVPCGCFGASRRAAGAYEVGRAFGLVLTMLTLCAVTAVNTDVDPTVGSLTVWSWGIAAVLTVSAVAPIFRFTTRSRASVTDGAPNARGIEHSRRDVMQGIGLAVAMLGTATAIPKDVLTAKNAQCKTDIGECRPNCQAAYDRCIGDNPTQKQCCINCYVSCQNYEHECTSGVSCSGSWHDPFSFFF
jgi:hypothetical protein